MEIIAPRGGPALLLPLGPRQRVEPRLEGVVHVFEVRCRVPRSVAWQAHVDRHGLEPAHLQPLGARTKPHVGAHGPAAAAPALVPPETAAATLAVSSTPPGASLTLNGRSLGTTPPSGGGGGVRRRGGTRGPASRYRGGRGGGGSRGGRGRAGCARSGGSI
ncbi:MAG: PEGA domain-containing protein [Myxococcales bacterium]|nr:PEGA domain-containing protein [Myxococcales bacterium]